MTAPDGPASGPATDDQPPDGQPPDGQPPDDRTDANTQAAANDQVVFVVGIGADGWDGLTRASQTAIATAQVIVGGRRQLELIPLVPGQDRRLWPRPLIAGLPGLMDELRQRSVTVVASGDPLLSGIGSTLIELLGADRVRVLPAVSSVSLAGCPDGLAGGNLRRDHRRRPQPGRDSPVGLARTPADRAVVR